MLMFCFNEDLQMMKYQSWFKKMVPVWLKVAMDACKEKIDKAVELDKVPKLDKLKIFQLDCLMVSFA